MNNVIHKSFKNTDVDSAIEILEELIIWLKNEEIENFSIVTERKAKNNIETDIYSFCYYTKGFLAFLGMLEYAKMNQYINWKVK